MGFPRGPETENQRTSDECTLGIFSAQSSGKGVVVCIGGMLGTGGGGGALSVKNREKNNSDKIRRNGFKCLKRERERIV